MGSFYFECDLYGLVELNMIDKEGDIEILVKDNPH